MIEQMTDDFTFYFGSASNHAQKACQRLEEPNVMLSYVTNNNEPWDCERLFIDSGGYSLLYSGEDHGSVDEYLRYIERVNPDIFALQDWPCEPHLRQEMDRSVSEHQELTAQRASETLEKLDRYDIDAQPVAVLQGWHRDEYLDCIRLFDEYGVLTDYIGIGSVCRRNATRDIRAVINSVHRELPNRDLHAFGVKTDVLVHDKTRNALTSSDSLAFEFRMMFDRPFDEHWLNSAYHYLNMKARVNDAIDDTTISEEQSKLSQAFDDDELL